jgi:hypothetical protein
MTKKPPQSNHKSKGKATKKKTKTNPDYLKVNYLIFIVQTEIDICKNTAINNYARIEELLTFRTCKDQWRNNSH